MSNVYLAQYTYGFYEDKESVINYNGDSLEAAKKSLNLEQIYKELENKHIGSEELTSLTIDMYRDGKFFKRLKEIKFKGGSIFCTISEDNLESEINDIKI